MSVGGTERRFSTSGVMAASAKSGHRPISRRRLRERLPGAERSLAGFCVAYCPDTGQINGEWEVS